MGTQHATVTLMHCFPFRLTALAALALWGSAVLAERYTLPLFVTSTAPGTTQGVLRIVNDTEESGSVQIHAIDDAGLRHGPATFMLNAGTAAEFDASDLASGNATKGLSPGLGTLPGDVRLEIESDLAIVPLAYVRAADGTLSAMHDTVRAAAAAGGGSAYRYEVPIFNAASDVTQESRLRLINPGDQPAAVTIDGRDDRGAEATGGTVRLTLPGGGARTLTAQQLEAGVTEEAALTGRLGAGVGRWRLSIWSDRLIQVVNVVSATAGYLNNLSTTAVPGAAPADHEAFSERFSSSGIEFRRGDGVFTITASATDRFQEAGESEGVAYSSAGSFRYQSIRGDAGLVTLLYDDGDVCRTDLYFESPMDGRFATRCTGSNSPEGVWSGGSWVAVDRGETMPEDPTEMVRERDCQVGLIVRRGEACTYPDTAAEFSVNTRGTGRFLDNLAGIRIDVQDETIDGRVYDFRAEHEADGEWRIERVAGMTDEPSFATASNPGDQTYVAGTAIDPLTLPEATGGNGGLTYTLSPEVPGLTFIASMRQLTGTPTAFGTYAMTYTVTDGDGDTDTLSFTITVVEADNTEGDGETGGDDDAAVSIGRSSCSAVRTGPTTVLVAVIGYVEAQRAASGVRVVGFVGDVLVGAQFLGDIQAGGTRNYAISGEIIFTGSELTCTSRVYFLLAAPIRGAGSTGVDLEAQF